MKILPILVYQQQAIHGGSWARVRSYFPGLTSERTTDRMLVTAFLENIYCIL